MIHPIWLAVAFYLITMLLFAVVLSVVMLT